MTKQKERNSSIELYRILLMLLIVAHHFVVNSDIAPIIEQTPMNIRNIYLLIYGAWGKTIINCFILITGYYMCKKEMKASKIFQIIAEVEFYKIIIFIIFLIIGKEQITIVSILKTVLPVNNIDKSFVSGYIVLLLLIPFLNKLIKNISKKEHLKLIIILLIIYTVLGSIPYLVVVFNYITWFVVLYFIGSYIRISDIKEKLSKNKYLLCFIITIIISILSILICYKYAITKHLPIITTSYYFLIDSNKILALLLSILSFIVFLNINIKTNKIINYVSKSVFGVLLIHANSDAMRQFLWKDLLRVGEVYYTKYIYIYSIVTVITIFIVCIIIDKLRIKLFDLVKNIYVKHKKVTS